MELNLTGFIKWEAFTPGGAPKHGQEVIAIHNGREEEMMYDSKYAAFLSKSSGFSYRPGMLLSESAFEKLNTGFPVQGRFYCLGAKYQEYVTHWRPKDNIN